MSRPIRFRAWCRDDKKIRAVLTLDLEHNHSIFVCDESDEGNSRLECHRFDLMQFTGLHDKNGREIYEGDIWSSRNDGKDGADVWDFKDAGYHVVAWNKSDAGFADLPYDEDSIYSPDRAEVVGNIYENPELVNP